MVLTDIGAGVEHTSNVSHEEFTNLNVAFVNDATIVLWNNLFLALVVVTHTLVTSIMCTPNSMHFLLMIALVYYISFSIILQPKLQAPPDLPLASSSTASHYLVAVSFYIVGMIYVCTNISFDPLQFKVQFVVAFIFVDSFLILGHIWDPVPLMTTIINCRFLYLVCIILINAIMYLMWQTFLKIPYIQG
jgi:hypothetical protein